MQRVRELHPADVALDPAHFGLKGLEIVELDPDALANRRAFDELDFAAVRREVEGANSEAVKAGTPDCHLS
jgi:hypothetical protein